MSGKEIKLTSSPETQTEWPIPPDYVPLWSVSQIEDELQALIKYRGHEAMPTVNEADVLGLILRIADDYNLKLAKAELDLWALEGVKNGTEGLVSEQNNSGECACNCGCDR